MPVDGVSVLVPPQTVIDKFDDVPDLRASDSDDNLAGDLVLVRDPDALYLWDATSLATDDGVTVIRPDDRSPIQMGRWINQQITNSADLSFLQAGTGAATSTVQDKLRETISVADFGAIGDLTADDADAIDAALAEAVARGGARVLVPGGYACRVTRTIYIPAYVSLEGPMPVHYPFNSAPGCASIVGDFADFENWVIESDVRTTGGDHFAYDEYPDDISDCIPAYNVGLRNLTLASMGDDPAYGGVRIMGCPGSSVVDVGISGVGVGFVLNNSFDCTVRVHSMGIYYGNSLWQNVNANSLELYAAQGEESPGVYATSVPLAYRLPFLQAMNGTLVGTYRLSTETHISRPFGLVMGANAGDLSVSCRIDYTTERYKGGCFIINARGIEFSRMYLEGGSAGAMEFGVVATNCTYNIHAIHALMDGGSLVDLGSAHLGSIAPGGLLTQSNFGLGPYAVDGSRLIIRNASPEGLGPATPRPTVVNPDLPGPWIQVTTGFTNSWTAGTNGFYYRINGQNVDLRGSLVGGTNGTAAYTLPAGYRPGWDVGIGGSGDATIGISTAGVITNFDDPPVSFDSLFFATV